MLQKGFKFMTFAQWYIKSRLRRYCTNQNSKMRIPEFMVTRGFHNIEKSYLNVQEKISQVKRKL